jgi:hypothetical protein
MKASNLITTDDVAQRLNVTPRIVDNMRKARRIPCVVLNRKTIRFDWPAVEAAISELVKKPIKTGKQAASKLKVVQR